ncbi:MAG: MFS transporter, partial [Proteobacteria bacterium]|nr:MFS transporter [Pseudomonadota bacterium]
LYYSAVLYVVVSFAFNVWGAAFLMRVHDMPIAEAGLFFGPVTGIAGFAGTLASGALADRLSLRDVRWQMWIPMLGGLGMLPFAVGFLFAPEPRVGLAFYALQVFLSTFWMGPSFWVCQGLARLRMRAMAAAILLLNINIFGTGLGPFALGILNDLFRGPYGELGIRYSLLTVCVLMFWAVFHSYRVSRTLAVDLAASRD